MDKPGDAKYGMTEQQMCIRDRSLCIPEELGYVDPHLVLQKEGKYDVPVHYRMKFDGQTPHQNHLYARPGGELDADTGVCLL